MEWREEEVAFVRDAAARGLSAVQCATAMAERFPDRLRTKSSIANRAAKWGISFHGRRVGGVEWDAAAIRLIEDLAGAGHSASRIAVALGEQLGIVVSRNAVIGKLSRMKSLPQSARKKVERRAAPRSPARSPASAATLKRKHLPDGTLPPMDIGALASVPTAPAEPESYARNVLDAQYRRDCKYPLSMGSPKGIMAREGHEMMVCGRPTLGRVYCPTCWPLAYHPAARRQTAPQDNTHRAVKPAQDEPAELEFEGASA